MTTTAPGRANRPRPRTTASSPCCLVTDPRARWQQRQDRAIIWLYPGPAETIVDRRHCTRCQPRTGYTSVDCPLCGDGPMLAAELAATTDTPPNPVLNWLTARGWRQHPQLGVICPTCATD